MKEKIKKLFYFTLFSGVVLATVGLLGIIVSFFLQHDMTVHENLFNAACDLMISSMVIIMWAERK